RSADAHRDHPPVAVLLYRDADLLAERGLARRAGKPAPLGTELPLAGDERTLWHLPLRRDGEGSRCQSGISRAAGIFLGRRVDWPAHLRFLLRHRSVVRAGRRFAGFVPVPRADSGME